MTKKILAITGIRSEYDIMFPVFRAIENHPDLSLELLVTGAHLSQNFGYTVEQIRRDGFKIADEVESLINGDSKSSRVKGAAVQLSGIIQTTMRVRPNFLMVLGDREESITTAIAGTYMDIPVVHLCGGDRVIGNVDDVVRHAVTKLSHIHLTTNEESKERILKLGEEEFRVFNVGNPGLDRFAAIPEMSRGELFQWYGFDAGQEAKPLLILVQHVLSSENEHAYDQMKETMEAVCSLGYPTVVSYPNSDAGGQGLIRCIEEYRHMSFIKIFKNVPRMEFVNTLRNAACLIGNSSLGIMEAPFLKLPAINVGNRQKGRLYGDNMIFVTHNSKYIADAIKTACFDEHFINKVKAGKNPYGDGKSSERIARILADINIDEKLLMKEITY